MVYGELGRYPIELQIKIKMFCFWNKIVGNPDKLSGKTYRLLFKLFISGNRDIHKISQDFIDNTQTHKCVTWGHNIYTVLHGEMIIYYQKH